MSDRDKSEESSELYCNAETKFVELEKVETVKKDQWGNELEFLCSCITLSVGLGNVWRYLPI
jgi:Sodium:neurotransmitter symporter family